MTPLKVLTKAEEQRGVCVNNRCFIHGHAGRLAPLSIICVVTVEIDTYSMVTNFIITPQGLSVNYWPPQVNKRALFWNPGQLCGVLPSAHFCFSQCGQFGFKLNVYLLITVGGGELSEQLGPTRWLAVLDRKKDGRKKMSQRPECCIWGIWWKFMMALWCCDCRSGATDQPRIHLLFFFFYVSSKCSFFYEMLTSDSWYLVTILHRDDNSSILMLENILSVVVMVKVWVWIQKTPAGWVVCLGSLPRWGLCFGSLDLAGTNGFLSRFQDTSDICFSYLSSSAVWATDKCSSNTRVSREMEIQNYTLVEMQH